MFQELNTKRKKQSFYITYGVFIINGMLALSIGSLMPYLREERGLTYAFCGILVSLHSCGNLVSSFVAGALPIRIGRRKTILIFQSFCILAYLFMLIGHHELMLILAFFMTGLARGASSNFNNMTINQLSPGSTWMINGLHSMFSLGAFAFPIILLCMTSKNAANWTFAVLFMIAAGVLSWFLYFKIPIEDQIIKKEKKKVNYSFFKEPLFLLCTLTLFFYLCAEQGVIGWLVTYFKDTGLVSGTWAQILASVLWIMVLIGRLATAWLSTKVDRTKLLMGMGVGFVVFFLLLIFTRTPSLIIMGIMCFGLSMAGIYPTTVSFAGTIINKYDMAWSFMLTFAGLGSIIMPSIIGKIAEVAGIGIGMSSIAIVVFIDLILIFSLAIYKRKRE